MRERWGCPDLPSSNRSFRKIIPGSKQDFDDCPAYYLRTARMGLPAEHLLDESTHPAQVVSEYAYEVENGARNVDTLSAKAREAVHLWISEQASRRRYEDEKRRSNAGGK